MMYYKFWDIIYAWYYLPSPYTFKYYSTKNNISNCLSTKFSYGISICTDSWYLYAMWDNRSFGSMTIALLGGQHTTWDNRMIYKTMTIALPLSQHTACNNRSIGSMAIALLGISVQRRIAGLSGQCLNSCLEFSTQRGRRALLS